MFGLTVFFLTPPGGPPRSWTPDFKVTLVDWESAGWYLESWTSVMRHRVLGSYCVTKQLQETVWPGLSQNQEKVIVKSVRHWRIQNERDILLRYQDRIPSFRPLLDEIEDASVPPTIVLKHLDGDALDASNRRRFTRPEVRYVAKGVLEAPATLHEDGFVHTGIKPSNVLVNYKSRQNEIHTVSRECSFAQDGTPIGTPIFRSLEAQDTSTISGFHIFHPGVPYGHEDDEIKIVEKYHRIFGPFPALYEEIADQQRLAVLAWIMQNSPAETLCPFRLTRTGEICPADREFVLSVMKLDPRDRPSARQLLEDAWFPD
ncbi:kinase-like domain-containing protein [Aspergillus aurantiobrunneus]